MNRLPAEKEYIKEHLRPIRFRGAGLILLGCIALLVWSVSELVTRVDAMDGMVMAYFKLVKNGDITLMTALQNLADSPEALKDLWTPVYLLGVALLSLLFSLMNGRRASLYTALPLVLMVLLTGPGGTIFRPLLTVSFIVKAASAALVIIGCTFTFTDVRVQKKLISRKYRKLLKKQSARDGAIAHGRKNTLIPERTKKCK